MIDFLSQVQEVFVKPDLTQRLQHEYPIWMIVSGIGELLWLPTYVLLLQRGWKHRTNTMPVSAILISAPLNFMFSFVCDVTRPDLCPHGPHLGATFGDIAALWVWRVCFGFSCMMLYLYIKHAREHPQDVNVPGGHAIPFVFVGLILSFALQYTFLIFENDFNGNQLYFLDTALMSAGFVVFTFARPGMDSHSYPAAWFRLASETLMLVGVVAITALAGPGKISLYPGYEDVPHAFVYCLAAAVIALDVIYVGILMRRRRILRAHQPPVLRT